MATDLILIIVTSEILRSPIMELTIGYKTIFCLSMLSLGIVKNMQIIRLCTKNVFMLKPGLGYQFLTPLMDHLEEEQCLAF